MKRTWDDNDYASLVNWVIRHSKCESYCLRLLKITKQMVCRFRFPFDIRNQSIIEESTNSNIYRFIGHRNDPLVCAHNRKKFQTWRANIDWSPVLSVQFVGNYIVKYAAKVEPASKTFTTTLRGIVEDLRQPYQIAISTIKRLMKSVSEREISTQEVCHLFMRYPLLKSSRKIIFLNLSDMNMLSSTVKRRQVVMTERVLIQIQVLWLDIWLVLLTMRIISHSYGKKNTTSTGGLHIKRI